MNFREATDLQVGKTIWDDQVTGLHLRAFPTKKCFYFFYRTAAGVQRRPKVGPFPELTIADARAEAKRLLREALFGRDPSLDKQNLRNDITVDQLFEEIKADRWDLERFKKSGWGAEAARLYRRNIKPTFATKKLVEVTAAEVRRWHKTFSENTYEGNRSLEVLKTMFYFAEEQEYRGQNTNPCAIVAPFEEKKRKRYCTPEEIALLLPILDREESKGWFLECAFVRLLLLTGARPSALRNALRVNLQVFEFNGERAGVLNQDGKSSADSGEEDAIVFSPAAMAIVDSLPTWSDRLVPVGRIQYFWNKVKKEIGAEDLWMRDLRRTFSTIGRSSGVDMDTIGALLNHRSVQTTKVYAKTMVNARMEAAIRISSEVKNLTPPTRSSELAPAEESAPSPSVLQDPS